MRRVILSIFTIFVITIVTYEWDSVSKFYNEIMNKVKNKKLTNYTVKWRKFNEDVEDLDWELEVRFVRYLSDYNKNYSKEEYKRRFKNFKASLKDIAILNKLENNTVFGLTKFSDMSKEEFADRVLLKHQQSCEPRHRECYKKRFEDDNNLLRSTYGDKINSSHDWRKQQGVVKPVLDQKLCQGCWAFSIVGVLESMSAIQLEDYKSRSIEELIDCSSRNNGCYNGSVIIAMDFICDNTLRFVTAEEYPLTLSMDKNCKPIKGYERGRRVKQFKHMCNMNEDVIVKMIATHGPLVVAVDATNWMNYIGGVIERACTRGRASHVVQIVGYERYKEPPVKTPVPYYIVRNSWGLDWGEKGYVKIAIHDNVCGIAEQVTAMDALNEEHIRNIKSDNK